MLILRMEKSKRTALVIQVEFQKPCGNYDIEIKIKNRYNNIENIMLKQQDFSRIND